MVLDTDTFNEIDDQFALVHALLSGDRVDLEAVYAAPFYNEKSTGPADGMRKSFQEIELVLDRCGTTGIPVLEGATEWLREGLPAAPSPATEDLIERALTEEGDPLYVVAIGAPTNVSSALLAAPKIIDRVVVVWLGGNALWWPTASEFNLRQDLVASRVLFDSGAALVHVPCMGVADHMITCRAEIEQYVRPAGKAGAFLADRFREHVGDGTGVSKVIWDMVAVGWLLDASWTTTVLAPSPVLTDEMTWSRDDGRHLIGEVTAVRRDAIFGDFFTRLNES
jgi:inosine-uridine nucleoside N-ribohydrolase